MTENEIYKDAIYYFGVSHQKIKAIEEMSELIKEIVKDLDGKGNADHIVEEMVDVEIMMAQLKIIYKNDAQMKEYKQQKLAYLNNLIFEEKYRQPEIKGE